MLLAARLPGDVCHPASRSTADTAWHPQSVSGQELVHSTMCWQKRM